MMTLSFCVQDEESENEFDQVALLEAQIAAEELAACSPMASEASDGSESSGDEGDDGQAESEEAEERENDGECDAEEEILQSQECHLDEEDMPSGTSSEAESGNESEDEEPAPDPNSLRAAAEEEEEDIVRNSSPDETSLGVLCDLQLLGIVLLR